MPVHPLRHRLLPAACTLLAAITLPHVASAQAARTVSPVSLGALVDKLLADAVAAGGAGCSVGVTVGDARVLRSAGMADLERAVPLTTRSIIEAGSVSKQFTAAAVILLALDGKLSLNDSVQRWFPELPTYDAPITVRHLLTHTSGLRDWGSVSALAGWPRGSRAYTNAHVLQVASRQRSLNYTPGAAYSYTNTGYNLLALLVERVSGQTLADFTRDRLFVPLGMSSTSWRDDHHRVVPNRALAYSGGRTVALAMPDESAYGNGGLLTTADDLVRWVEALNRQALGAAFTNAMSERMVLSNGDTIPYALGVNVLAHRGTRELSHSGSTGGYRAHLLHFPERQGAVAVLCNAANLGATRLAEQLADSVIARRSPRARSAEPIVRPLFAARARAAVPASELRRLTGTYASADVGGEPFVIALEGNQLVLRQAPSLRRVVERDSGSVFRAGALSLWFDRNAAGDGEVLHIAQDRVWDMLFPRTRRSLMSTQDRWLPALAGTWTATNRLWFTPTSEAAESPITLTLDAVVGDTVSEMRYAWSHDGTPHHGVLLVRDAGGDSTPEMVWFDSFHTGGTFMLFRDGVRTATSLSAAGTYAAPPGPDWGWRIQLEPVDADGLLLRMYNITPEGEEGLAVEARLTRQDAP